jgi:CDP-diacylglycerol--glycerol-3-phosphate 3-phosphatidyltransferase
VTPPAGAASGESSWTNPANAVTLLRVALVPIIAAFLFLEGTTARWWAFAVFTVAAVSDSVDGWLARRWQGSTRWGQLADPAADKLLVIGTLAILAWFGDVSWWVVGIVVVREVSVTVQRQMLARRGFVMPASVYGKAKTISQMVAIALFLLPAVPRGLAEAVLWVAVVLTIASGLEYVWRGRRLVRAG